VTHSSNKVLNSAVLSNVRCTCMCGGVCLLYHCELGIF